MTQIMGIINITPDSFSDGGSYFNCEMAIERAHELVRHGADILDIGGESTRPGAQKVSAQEEMDRVCPVIEALAPSVDVPISIDTYKSKVADAALKVGATVVNDISGLTFDDDMAKVIAAFNAGAILMHIQGTPETMQENPEYDDLVDDIYGFLEKAAQKAIDSGVDRNRIIIDPGIGFGKTLDDNYVIINNIAQFKKMGYSVLIGLSRKSLISKLSKENAEDRLPATLALNVASIINGADIIRVHDVREHKLALDSIKKLKEVSGE